MYSAYKLNKLHTGRYCQFLRECDSTEHTHCLENIHKILLYSPFNICSENHNKTLPLLGHQKKKRKEEGEGEQIISLGMLQ